MVEGSIEYSKIKNIDAPFTELFSLLKCYENLTTKSPSLVYNSNELRVIHQHTDNAIAILLHGLQGIGHLMGMAQPNKKNIEEISQLGFFIDAIANLTEALNDLRSDANHVLEERAVMNY